jgi:hypothetical protein
MDSSGLVLLLGMSLFIIVPCFMVLVFAGIVAVFVLILRQSQNLGRPETLEARAAELAPWGAESFADLSAQWDGRYAAFIGTFVADGAGASLREPGRPLLATVYRRSGQEHFLEARTSQHHVRLNFGDDAMTALVDGQVLGVMRFSTGELFDEMRRPVGQCRRPQGLQLFVSGIDVGNDRGSFPLVMNGQTVAQLTVALPRSLFAGGATPLVQDIQRPLESEAEAWLLVLCALELGYYAARRAAARARSRV